MDLARIGMDGPRGRQLRTANRQDVMVGKAGESSHVCDTTWISGFQFED